MDPVLAAARSEPGVVVARVAMFTCSDATQQEILRDIEEQHLDGMVVASCSPKLHVPTFKGVAERAGLDPHMYTQVNIREQCSWVHTDDREGATGKAIRLVRAGIARTRLSSPLEPISVETTPNVLVIGGGISGLRAAIGLADIGLAVFLVERDSEVGGWVGRLGEMYAQGKNGRELIARLTGEIEKRPTITVFTNAEVVAKSGRFGNYQATIRINRQPAETIQVGVGAIIVATGFEVYRPQVGEFGYGMHGVVTLPEFEELIAEAEGRLLYEGKPVQDIIYIYCVGSRQAPDVPGANQYCSRYCCTAAVHASLRVAEKAAIVGTTVRQYHLYRDMRTYGKYELMYARSREEGSLYLRFPDDVPPSVSSDPRSGRLTVTVRDLLTGGEEITIPADLVVLITGMVARPNDELVGALKLPIGQDGFFNEIHPKLRPVETVVDGVLIAGAAQGPKNSAEAVASGLAAVTQAGAILKKGVAELDPLVATVDPLTCSWCGRCVEACPYGAIGKASLDGKEIAVISEAVCKGCGGCVPTCPENAIDLLGHTDAQVRAMIDALLEEAVG